MLLNVFALGRIARAYLKIMPQIQDKSVFWAKATKKPILKAWMLTWQMCVYECPGRVENNSKKK